MKNTKQRRVNPDHLFDRLQPRQKSAQINEPYRDEDAAPFNEENPGADNPTFFASTDDAVAFLDGREGY